MARFLLVLILAALPVLVQVSVSLNVQMQPLPQCWGVDAEMDEGRVLSESPD